MKKFVVKQRNIISELAKLSWHILINHLLQHNFAKTRKLFAIELIVINYNEIIMVDKIANHVFRMMIKKLPCRNVIEN